MFGGNCGTQLPQGVVAPVLEAPLAPQVSSEKEEGNSMLWTLRSVGRRRATEKESSSDQRLHPEESEERVELEGVDRTIPPPRALASSCVRERGGPDETTGITVAPSTSAATVPVTISLASVSHQFLEQEEEKEDEQDAAADSQAQRQRQEQQQEFARLRRSTILSLAEDAAVSRVFVRLLEDSTVMRESFRQEETTQSSFHRGERFNEQLRRGAGALRCALRRVELLEQWMSLTLTSCGPSAALPRTPLLLPSRRKIARGSTDDDNDAFALATMEEVFEAERQLMVSFVQCVTTWQSVMEGAAAKHH